MRLLYRGFAAGLLLAVLLCAAVRAEEASLRSATLRAVGDIMVHEPQLRAHRLKDGGYNFLPAFELIKDSLLAADYTFGNLEGTVGKLPDKGYTGFPTFNAPADLLDALQDAGVDMLTLANNHMLDRSEDGVIKTLDELDARNIAHVGANRSMEERAAPCIVEVCGIRLGFLAYAQHTNGMEKYTDAQMLPFLVNMLGKTAIEKDIEALRQAGAEVIVANVHWGEEYKRKPEEATQTWAQRLADAGVDVIIGSHPHNVQPVRYVERSDGQGRALVAYSLGNFLGTMYDRYADGGIILQFTINERADGGFDISDAGYVPTYLWKGAERNKGRVVRVVPIAKHWNQRLRGMNKSTFDTMRQSLRDSREVMGEALTLLSE